MTKAIKRYAPNNYGVFVALDALPFPYSDGDIENELLRIILHAKDCSTLSSELASVARDWVTSYHFSSLRANLLRPFESTLKNKLVLELGCGCGAITRFLGENTKTVVSVEGSERRANIAASRCRDLSNVHVFCDTIQGFESKQKFDVVTLIGVLEYARLFDTSSECPEKALLEKARNFLKDDGVLIVAIENKLGLKYFAGVVEDHTREPYFGINNRYTAGGVVTFGRKEIVQLFSDAGFPYAEQHIPLPDYKLPISMVHGVAFTPEAKCFNIVPLVEKSYCYDKHLASSKPVFSLESATKPIIENGLLQDLCNSFLFLLSPQEREVAQPNLLASHYGVVRRKEFAKEKKFFLRNSSVQIEESFLLADELRENSPLVSVLETAKYQSNPLLVQSLTTVINSPGWEIHDVVQCLQPWFDLLEKREIQKDGVGFLRGLDMDLVPGNLLVNTDGTVDFFDQEWDSGDTIETKYVIFRGIFGSFAGIVNCAQPAQGIPLQIATITALCMAKLGKPLDAEEIVRFAKKEAEFQKKVLITDVSESALLSVGINWRAV